MSTSRVSAKHGPRPCLRQTGAVVSFQPHVVEPSKKVPGPRPKAVVVNAAAEKSPSPTYAEVLTTPPPSKDRLARPRKTGAVVSSQPHVVEPSKKVPGPHLKAAVVNAAAERSPSPTYAEVLTTPPPKDQLARPRRVLFREDSAEARHACIIDISSSGESPPPPVTKSSSRVSRSSASQSGRTMVTRSSSGNAKKRALDEPAVVSDLVASSALTPSKKRKVVREHGASGSSNLRTPRGVPISRSRLKVSRGQRLSPIASDFPASDATPSKSIATPVEKRSTSFTRSLRLAQESVPIPSRHQAMDVDSDKETLGSEGQLLPSVEIRSSSPGVESQHLDSHDEEWQGKISEDLHKRRRSSSRHKNRACSASPLDWSQSPPSTRSRSKGKARAVTVERAETPVAASSAGDQTPPLRRATLPGRSSGASKHNKKSSTIVPHTSKPAKLNSFEAALALKGISMQTAMDMSAAGSPSKHQYLADLNGYHVPSLPEECEVNSPSIQDVLLAEDYANLPNLRAGSFRSWSTVGGNGFVCFAGWATQLPGLDIEDAFAAICFTQHRHFVNLSRISPLELHSVFTTPDRGRSLLHADQRMAICLSAILVVESHLRTASDKGLRNKFIKGTLHEQEMQRMVGATCMVFAQTVLHAQIERDNMVFTTNGSWRSEGTSNTPSAARYVRSSALFGRSPSKGSGQSRKQVLDVTDTVPIYDARAHLFDYANDLEHIDSVLPLYEGEIPAGSFAVVAYTLSTYKKAAVYQLNTNVQFVILVKDFV